MRVIIQPDRESATQLTAKLIAKAVRENPKLVMGLATGRTMELVYELLAEMHTSDGLDFSLVQSFNLDEYEGLAPESPDSYRYYMNHHLFSKVNIPIESTYLPNGVAKDITAECLRYDNAIADCGGIDLQLLGIGTSGHIGFNEPLSSLNSRTRAVTLAPKTIEQNSPLFPKPEDMPPRGITMGVGTILESKSAVLLATGTDKADILAKAVEGPITSMISASALQLHNNCTIVVDEDAGSLLKAADYYRSFLKHEPDLKELIKGQ